MPIYEYTCQNCQSRFSLLMGMTADASEEKCPKCASTQIQRLVSRFVRGRNEDQRVEEVADWVESSADPESPAQMRQMVREMGKALDEDVSDDMEEMLEAEYGE